MSVCVLGWDDTIFLQCYCGVKSEECTGCSPRVHFVGGFFRFRLDYERRWFVFEATGGLGTWVVLITRFSSGSWIMYWMQ